MFNRFLHLLCALAAVVILATAAPVRAQTSRIEAEVNNTAYDGTPVTTYKNTSFTLLPDGVRFYSRFQWDGSPVESAELNFYITSFSSNATVAAYAVSPSYDPDTLNWTNQPGSGSLLGSVLVTGTGWWAIDVASYVNSRSGEFAIFIVNTSGGNNVVQALPYANHVFIEYVAAPGTKPAAPLHCYNFDDNTDSIGTADFALQSGATLTSTAVVDTGIGVATAQTAATFPALATAANGGFTVSGWWLIDSTFTEYDLTSADSDFSFFIQGSTANVSSPSGNNYGETVSIPEGWNYVAGGISDAGLAHLIANTTYYTYAVSLPESTATTASLTLQDAGRVDQLMVFNYALSRLEHLWLWNGGRGRSCWEFGTPSQVITYTIEIAQPTPAYTSTLPFGNQGDVHLTMTAGDIVISLALIALATISLAVVLRDVAHRSAAK